MKKRNFPFLVLDLILVVLSILEYPNSHNWGTHLIITYFLLIGLLASIISVLYKFDEYFISSHKLVIYSISVYMIVSTMYSFVVFKDFILTVILVIQTGIVLIILKDLLKKLKEHGENY